MKKLVPFAFLLIFLCIPFTLFAQTITVVPETVIQGEPFMVTLSDKSSKVTFEGKAVSTFMYDGKLRAFIPIDINKKAGKYVLKATNSKGAYTEKNITVAERKKIEAPLGIPAKLGGNTPASQKNLVDTLAKENATLLGITTGAKTFWTKPFIFPVEKPVVTDNYGYNRKTGEYTIPHKGTDFHADSGTSVKAMNRGVVRVARTYTIYGKTVIIDHGLGLQTFYMHMSKINVKEGQLVEQGDIIGLSGMTGYAEMPHLHLTVRMNDISIDPMKFMDFFK